MLSRSLRAGQQLLRGAVKGWSAPSAGCSSAAEIEKNLPPPPKSPVSPPGKCPVQSYNEWDPLEEVLLGRPEGAIVPKVDAMIKACIRPNFWGWMLENAGKPYHPEEVKLAVNEVNEFQRVLELEGCVVRRPDPMDWASMGEMRTPDFAETGFASACPRDSLVVVGDEIIEATMSWRCRYFETRPWKKVLNHYFREGARWTLAPKPTMTDELYDQDYPYEDQEARTRLAAQGKYVLTEAEPCFDAADIIRFGKDIFIQLSEATNWGGVEWLRRHLAPTYRVHPLNLLDGGALHIDASFLPLRPGFILANPDRPCLQIDFFRKNGWEIVYAPRPSATDEGMLYASAWLSINVLSLDEERVVVYKHEKAMVDILKKHGFKPIGVDLTNAFGQGGAFHCWTTDIRRRGELKSYFDHV